MTNFRLWNSLAQLVKGSLAFGIFISYGIAMYVAIDLTWNKYLMEKMSNNRCKLLWEYVIRTGIALIACMNNENTVFYFTFYSENLIETFFDFSSFSRCNSKVWSIYIVVWCILSFNSWSGVSRNNWNSIIL